MITTNNIIKYTKYEDIEIIQFQELLKLGINHAYTLRGLDFRHRDLEKEAQNYKILCDHLGLDYKNISKACQRHTNNVRIIDQVMTPEQLEKTDGLITNKKGIILSTTNADCILYLIYDKNKKIISNVHSGWRGTYEKIIEVAIKKMIQNFGSNPQDIVICSCPSIRKCHFEVDKDVKEMFEKKFEYLKIDYIKEGRKDKNIQKYNIDTIKLNKKIIENLNIPTENIIDSEICSVCEKDKINSYRVDGKEKFKLSTAIITLD